jgi:hypothetical protein
VHGLSLLRINEGFSDGAGRIDTANLVLFEYGPSAANLANSYAIMAALGFADICFYLIHVDLLVGS